MTRKDYIRIAGAFRNRKPDPAYESLEWTKGFNYAMNGVIHVLAADNPRFDREHFLAVVDGKRELTSRPQR